MKKGSVIASLIKHVRDHKKKSTEYLHEEKSVTMGKIFISAVSSVVATEAKCQKIRNPEDWIN